MLFEILEVQNERETVKINIRRGGYPRPSWCTQRTKRSQSEVMRSVSCDCAEK